MPKLPAIKIAKLLKTLLKLGFVKHHQSGSHLQLKHVDGRRVTIPMHLGKDIKKGTLNGIIKDINLTKDDFIRALKQ
ncbi:hypothetical protein COS52_00970 [Candidatus Roizmanbacteria bacterium CG03_land_8_20_14_0_80_39_12]|uniref:Type II toxin-antitoxin system HicA family toxin n=1 Tax=Candidatus Roizmanbacteria bacterium CG03_land_8_20_14_0_80_39_12 TaxID=1974847 RepID=A0A2M7BTG6_9BACT|nr:MAG: hypothetical protein COS52_00970 [Candidatus Roizmanbacteria bacterium CG03_land_8_20_14_0_80_39_12]